jgi:DNA-binding Xre family transcriptional regulator
MNITNQNINKIWQSKPTRVTLSTFQCDNCIDMNDII